MTPTLFVYAVVAAGGLLALWLYVRVRRAPDSLLIIGAHLLVSLVLLELAPRLIARSGGADLSTGEAVAGVLLFLLPALTYVFVAAIFLIVRLQAALHLR